MSTIRSRSTRRLVLAGVVLASLTPAGIAAANGDRHDRGEVPRLTGRAVLPVGTYADGPQSGAGFPNATNDPDGDKKVNGIQFPTPSQPVQGFSGIVEGDEPGEWLAMADNGFGAKANSRDFNLRAYTIKPEFKTAGGGSGAVDVIDWIEFRDPRHNFPYTIVNEGKPGRVLTGGDIDPESIQRGRDGTLWVGDEFGPWILHFDAQGRLLEAPYELPDGLTSVNHPTTPGPILNSGGFEAMAMSPNGRTLYAILEKGVPGDDLGTRRVYEFDVRSRQFAGVVATYKVDFAGATPTAPDPILVADAQMLDRHHMLVIERDNTGGGLAAAYRRVYEVDLRDADANTGILPKTQVVDLVQLPDPDLVSLPPIHTGDVGLASPTGDPFRVVCESIEALRVVGPHELLLGCDNNFPNKGRNPNLADDNELITITF